MKKFILFLLTALSVVSPASAALQAIQSPQLYDVFVSKTNPEEFFLLTRFDNSGYRYHLLWHPPSSLAAKHYFYSLPLPADFESHRSLRDFEGFGFQSDRIVEFKVQAGSDEFRFKFNEEARGTIKVYMSSDLSAAPLEYERASPASGRWNRYRTYLANFPFYQDDASVEEITNKIPNMDRITDNLPSDSHVFFVLKVESGYRSHALPEKFHGTMVLAAPASVSQGQRLHPSDIKLYNLLPDHLIQLGTGRAVAAGGFDLVTFKYRNDALAFHFPVLRSYFELLGDKVKNNHQLANVSGGLTVSTIDQTRVFDFSEHEVVSTAEKINAIKLQKASAQNRGRSYFTQHFLDPRKVSCQKVTN